MVSRGLRVVLGTAASLLVMLVQSHAVADVTVERSEDAAACPDTTAFAARVEAARTAPDVLVRFERTPHGYRSAIRMSDGAQRWLADEAASCDGLADATALAVKLALDLEAETQAIPPAESRPTYVAHPGSAPPDAPTAARKEPFAEVSFGGVVAFGLTHDVAPGLRGGGSLSFAGGSVSVGVTGLALPAQSRNVDGGSVDVSAIGGGIEACGRLLLGQPLRLAVCARTEALRLEGQARGFSTSETRARPLFTGSILARVSTRVAGPLALFLEAGAVMPFVRERFGIDRVGVVYEPSVVAAVTGIGASVDFE